MTYCTACGTELPVPAEAFCLKCGAGTKPIEETQEVVLSESPPSPAAFTPKVLLNPGLQFLENAKTGLTRWWRWVLGTVLILVIWQGVGSIPLGVACGYLSSSTITEFSCGEFGIIGESLIPNFVLSNYGFIIGIIGVWLVVKLLHKKTLTAMTTGRLAFDYNRVIFAMVVGLLLMVGFFLLQAFLSDSAQTGITFQSPNPWEYLTFFLFAIVLTPYQAGFEEIFFRGYITQGISHFTTNKAYLAFISGFLFMLPHLLNPETGEYGLLPFASTVLLIGIFLACLTLFDGGIELACGFHAINNLWVHLIISTEVSVMATPSLFVIQVEKFSLFPDILVQAITYFLLFILFNYKYKWFSWKPILKKFTSEQPLVK
jgi:membrane protease YdiL (CAAX protease family)